ncbi:hypothetical protein ABZ915_42370 [Streptomyces sp. NPDC046915]
MEQMKQMKQTVEQMKQAVEQMKQLESSVTGRGRLSPTGYFLGRADR